MRYSFTTPQGWSRTPFPPPQRGVYLRSPVSTPSPESASILLFDAVMPAGGLPDHLAALIEQSCEGLKIAKQNKPAPVKTAGYTGLTVSLTISVPGSGVLARGRDELRLFSLIDAGNERLPVAFVGGPKSLPMHHQAYDLLVHSIGPLVLAAELYTRWLE